MMNISKINKANYEINFSMNPPNFAKLTCDDEACW